MLLNTIERYFIKNNTKIKLLPVEVTILQLLSDRKPHSYDEFNLAIYGTTYEMPKVNIRKYVCTLKSKTKLNIQTITKLGYVLYDNVTVQGKNKLLTENEYKYLTNIINPFIDKVTYITKLQKSNNKEYIVINVRNCENIVLPYFEINTRYKNLVLNTKYTLNDLGLKGEK